MGKVKIAPEVAEAAVRETDWTAVDTITDADIARQIAENPDAVPIPPDEKPLAARIRALRKLLGMSQAEFASRYRIPLATLRDWEQARLRPDAPALAYLTVIERSPWTVERALRLDAAGRPTPPPQGAARPIRGRSRREKPAP